MPTRRDEVRKYALKLCGAEFRPKRSATVKRDLPDDFPWLSGPGAPIRQVIAAYFVRDCPHVIEIGGHIRPITNYLTHSPLSVLSVDPKTPPFEAEQLNGKPCRVRHLTRMFQAVNYDYETGSYGLVLLGYSLKPRGHREPIDQLLFNLIDNANTVVLEYTPADNIRASSQVPSILSRPSLRILCEFEITIDDARISGTPYRRRRFHVLKPAASEALARYKAKNMANA
jgi:hypothetical protein